MSGKRRRSEDRSSSGGQELKWVAKPASAKANEAKDAKPKGPAPEAASRDTHQKVRNRKWRKRQSAGGKPKAETSKSCESKESPELTLHERLMGGVVISEATQLQHGKSACPSAPQRARGEIRRLMIARQVAEERARMAGMRDAERQLANEAKLDKTAPPMRVVEPIRLNLVERVASAQVLPNNVVDLVRRSVHAHIVGVAPTTFDTAVVVDTMSKTALRAMLDAEYQTGAPIVGGSNTPPEKSGRPGLPDRPIVDPTFQASKPVAANIAGPDWDDVPEPFYVYAKRSLLSRILALPVVAVAWPLKIVVKTLRRLVHLSWDLPEEAIIPEDLQQLRVRLTTSLEPRTTNFGYGWLHRLQLALYAWSCLSNSISPVLDVVPRTVTRLPAGMIDIRPSDRCATAYPDRPNYLRVSTVRYLRWFTARDIVDHEDITNMLTETMKGARNPNEWENYRRKATALNSAHNADSTIWAAASDGSYEMAALRSTNYHIDRTDLHENKLVNFPDEPRGVPAREIAASSAVVIVLARFVWNPALRMTLRRLFIADLNAVMHVVSCSARLAQRFVVFGLQSLTLVTRLLSWLARFIDSLALPLQ